MGGVGHAGLVVLAVGHQHEHLVVVLLLFKRPQRLADRLADGGAALRDDVGGEGVDVLHEGVAVDRQRALQKRGAGEGDQAKAVALGQAHQVEHGQLGPLEPVRGLVGGQHTARGVHGNEDVEAAGLGFLQLITALWPGQGDKEQQHDAEQQGQLGLAPGRGETKRELFHEVGVDEACHPLAPPPPRPAKEEAQQRHDQRRQPQNLGMFKMHEAPFQKRAGTILAPPRLGHAKMHAPGRGVFVGN